MRRQTIRLTLRCSNTCVFCAQQGVAAGTPDDELVDVPAALATARESSDEVSFTGGEPMLAPTLRDAIEAAREQGFRRIGIQTNGSSFDAGLAAAGLTDVHVSLHGATATVHDYHTGVAGSYRRLLDTIGAARARKLTVVATSVLTRSNFRVIGELPWLLKRRGVAAWTIAVPHTAGRAADNFDRVAPRLGLALPYALHALQAAAKIELPAWIDGAPLCGLGPFAARALAPRPRSFARVCDDCAARNDCPGIDPIYLRRFGDEELKPQATAAAIAADHELQRLFVGAGELGTVPDPTAVHEPPSDARKRLPMIGRSQPAEREVPKTGENKSGDELREIFPELFERVEE